MRKKKTAKRTEIKKKSKGRRRRKGASKGERNKYARRTAIRFANNRDGEGTLSISPRAQRCPPSVPSSCESQLTSPIYYFVPRSRIALLTFHDIHSNVCRAGVSRSRYRERNSSSRIDQSQPSLRYIVLINDALITGLF